MLCITKHYDLQITRMSCLDKKHVLPIQKEAMHLQENTELLKKHRNMFCITKHYEETQ